MEYAVIELDGSTVALFQDAGATRTYLRRSARLEGYAIDELAVLGYSDGVRAGDPRPANEFLPSPTPMHLSVALPEPSTGSASQNAVLKLERVPTLSWSLVESIMLSRLSGPYRHREAVA
jgi:hypothetical protein